MTQPNPPSEQVESFARRYRKTPSGSFYAAFVGSVEHSLNTAGLSETERLTRISDALTALDMVRAEVRAVFTVPAAVPLVDETPATPVTVHFTFGVGHFDGTTDLFGRYVTVIGPSWQRCRQAMVNRYGGAWCDQYGWDSPTWREVRRRLTEHERIVVDGESNVRLVLDDVHAEALAEDAQLSAAELVHWLEPGAEGALDDTVACGRRIGDISGYATDGSRATCKGCVAALAELDS